MKPIRRKAEPEHLEVLVRVMPLSGPDAAQLRQRQLAVIAKLLQRSTALEHQGDPGSRQDPPREDNVEGPHRKPDPADLLHTETYAR